MYSIEIPERVREEIRKLDRQVRERIVAALERRRVRPFPQFSRLAGSPYFRLRVGDYRVIASIDQAGRRITLLKVGHRENVYG